MDELLFIAYMWRGENDLIEIGNLDNELMRWMKSVDMAESDSMMWFHNMDAIISI